jgi:uncharacterized protein YlxW (UPF0749 family)
MTDPVESAEPGLPPEPLDGRTRLLQALRRPGSRGQVTVAILLGLLGFAAVTQVHANDSNDQYVGARQGDLVQYINNLSLASQRAETQIGRLEQTRDALRNDTRSRRTAVERARQQADSLGILAGTVPAVGPGIRVTVTDEKGGVGSNQLLEGIEELRDAGAEVIEINDKVRVVAQTSLSDADTGVVVDGQLLRPPYVIDAIGNAHSLARALEFHGGFTSEVEGPSVDASVSTKELDEVEVSTVVDPAEPRYAQSGSTG